jgi:hypothetical protein
VRTNECGDVEPYVTANWSTIASTTMREAERLATVGDVADVS